MAPRPPSHGVPRRCSPPHARPVGRLPLPHPPGPQPGLVTPCSSRRTPGPSPTRPPDPSHRTSGTLYTWTSQPRALLDSRHTRRIPSHPHTRRGPRLSAQAQAHHRRQRARSVRVLFTPPRAHAPQARRRGCPSHPLTLLTPGRIPASVTALRTARARPSAHREGPRPWRVSCLWSPQPQHLRPSPPKATRSPAARHRPRCLGSAGPPLRPNPAVSLGSPTGGRAVGPDGVASRPHSAHPSPGRLPGPPLP